MSKKSLIIIQVVDLFGTPISKAKYHVRNQKTGGLIAEGLTDKNGKIVQVSRDKGTILDIYLKNNFSNVMDKVQSFTMSKDRMVAVLRRKSVQLNLKTFENLGKNGGYQRKTAVVVKSGDTLTSIAKKHSTTVRALVLLNKIKNPDKLNIGQVIKLPVNIPANGNNAHYDKSKATQSTNNPKEKKSPTTQSTDIKKQPQNTSKPTAEPTLYENAKKALEEKYEEMKKTLETVASEASKIFVEDDRSLQSGTPKALAQSVCKTNPQCISSGKSELIREVNIRLAGFGGALPTDEFTELTAKCIRQFQRDYMGATETGKICGSLLVALDKFRDEYGIASYFNSMKCPCGKCTGFGNGRDGVFNFPVKTGFKEAKAVEHPGMHRSLIWGFKAMRFYFSHMLNSKGYKINLISSGYRCIDNNFIKKRATTNHMGNALDMQITDSKNQIIKDDELENIIRKEWFCKYLNAAMGWKNNQFGLELLKHGATTWIHLDVREFDNTYKAHKLYSKNIDGLNGDYIVNLFNKDTQASVVLSCSGNVSLENLNIPDSTLDELIQKLGDIISHGEGNYESYNSGTKNVKNDKVGYSFRNPPKGTVTSKTINQIIVNAQSKDGNDKNRLFATGKYQTTFKTLIGGKEKGYYTGAETYDANMQEKVFKEYLLAKRPVLHTFVHKGQGTVIDAQYHAAKEWASIAVPKGLKLIDGRISNGNQSFYEKPGQNSASSTSTKSVIEILTKIKNFHDNRK